MSYEDDLVIQLYQNMSVNESDEQLYDEIINLVEGKNTMAVIDTLKLVLMSACKIGIDDARMKPQDMSDLR